MSKRRALRIAKRLGVEMVISKTEEYLEVTVESPAGMVWSCSKVHGLVSTADSDHKEGIADLWSDMADRMGCGIEACSNPECELCCGEVC